MLLVGPVLRYRSAWTLLVGGHAGTAGTIFLFGVMFAAVELSYRYIELPMMRWTKASLASGGSSGRSGLSAAVPAARARNAGAGKGGGRR